MHPRVFAEFEAICRQRFAGGAVLEVGATASTDSLLNLPALAKATRRVGINLDGPIEGHGYRVLQGNANRMDCFRDAEFDAVLCNSTLEHDRCFWRSVDEMHRVLRPGGLLVLGVPGYANLAGERWMQKFAELVDLAIPRARRLGLRAATLTLEVHDFPGDYYRFSEQAMREVLLGGFADTGFRRIMLPPRMVGWGTKPTSSARNPSATAERKPGAIVWLTGLPGAGKTTLARNLRACLATNRTLEILDGDETRPWLSSELGYSRKDRDTNIRRIAKLACLLARHGALVLVAVVSPYAAARAEARELAQTEGVPFMEVFVEASHETRVARDPKGMYARALRGEIAEFTGVSAPYEIPTAPNLVVNTDGEQAPASTQRILELLRSRGLA